jgi:hypothetical protein
MDVFAEYDAERNVTVFSTTYLKDGETATATVEMQGKANNSEPAKMALQDIIDAG